ncbi:His Kinase A (phospho-acceptor) domain-containing protein [Terriglobus roseus]|uniref:histidine kinase n=2 Tax=Terriglobus roseus TaxID=392734 RepID=A0A1H4J6P5_9BACT|nr:His Kinase A (phospho-acceptor) domain-containing protein [Terriglobus roseus]
MESVQSRIRSPEWKAAVIAFLIVALAVTTWIIPPHAVVLHNILHHLNILPFMLAGMIFGWKGALRAIVFAVALQSPIIYRHWYRAPVDAQDQVVELSTFGIAGMIAGLVADRERMQRARVEATKRELERVYSELRENIQQMKKTERLTAAGELAASLAHEIRNPLASISGAAGVVARGHAPAASQQECLEILMKESQRLNKLLTNFLDFARPRLPRFQPTDPAAVLQSVTTLAQHSGVERGVDVVLHTKTLHGEVECDAEQVKQVLLNLVLNAIQATTAPGTVNIRAAMDTQSLSVEVEDEGCGVEPENMDRLFDPFFTTKENGSGLGLAVSANIVAQHGGTLFCRMNEAHRRGMTFRVDLPLHPPSVSELAKAKDKAVLD